MNEYENQKRRNKNQTKDAVIRGILGFKDYRKQCHNPGARGEHQAKNATYRKAHQEKSQKAF